MRFKLELFGWQMWFKQKKLNKTEIKKIEDYVSANNLVLEDSWWKIEGEFGMDVFDVEFVKPYGMMRILYLKYTTLMIF